MKNSAPAALLDCRLPEGSSTKCPMSTENEPGANRWASCSGAPEGSSSHIKQVLLHHFEYNNYGWRSPPHIAETELLFSYFLNKPEETLTPSQLTASQVTPAGYPIMSQCFWPTARGPRPPGSSPAGSEARRIGILTARHSERRRRRQTFSRS